MKKFEYEVVCAADYDLRAASKFQDEEEIIQTYLNAKGCSGWELVEFKRTKDNRFRMIFKREATG